MLEKGYCLQQQKQVLRLAAFCHMHIWSQDIHYA